MTISDGIGIERTNATTRYKMLQFIPEVEGLQPFITNMCRLSHKFGGNCNNLYFCSDK